MPQHLFEPEKQTWNRSIPSLLAKLGIDLHNHRMLADPWQRKAYSMAKSWTVLFRYGHPPHPRKPIKLASDWTTAALAMARSLGSRAQMQRTRKGWNRWAADRAMEAHRWPGKYRQVEASIQPAAGDNERSPMAR